MEDLDREWEEYQKTFSAHLERMQVSLHLTMVAIIREIMRLARKRFR